MKVVYLLISFLLLWITTSPIYSQSCISEYGAFEFFSQDDVDQFFANNPGCEVIDGDMYLGQDLDYSKLPGIREITGGIWSVDIGR